MSERGSNEPAWRIVRLRLDKNTGVWRAVGTSNGRIAVIVMPPSVKGESANGWLERIDQAFEMAASPPLAPSHSDSNGH